jgi:hypothetical protein
MAAMTGAPELIADRKCFGGAMVPAADIRGRDRARALLASIGAAFPWLRHVFADGGDGGE